MCSKGHPCFTVKVVRHPSFPCKSELLFYRHSGSCQGLSSLYLKFGVSEADREKCMARLEQLREVDSELRHYSDHLDYCLCTRSDVDYQSSTDRFGWKGVEPGFVSISRD